MSFVFVSKDHVIRTRHHLSSAHGVWKKIGEELQQEADEAMNKGPWSVTYYPSRAASGNPNDYYYEAPYWWPNSKDPAGPYIRRDGHEYPDRHKDHWLAFQKLSKTVLILCYAGYYMDNKTYLKRAVKLLKVWFLDPKTRMNPHMDYAEAIAGKRSGNRTGIIALWQLDRIVHALGFLQEYPNWNKELSGMTDWISAMLSWILDSKKGKEERLSGNNHAAWCVTHIATYAAFLQKPTILRNAFELYKKEIIPKQIALNGSLPPELKRTKAFSYSLLNLEAQTLLCEIAYQQGVNLWGYKTADGKGIETAIRFILPYLNNPSKWKYQQIDGAIPDDQISLQYAALRLNIPECLKINRKRRGDKRFIRDQSPLGPLALLPGFPTES